MAARPLLLTLLLLPACDPTDDVRYLDECADCGPGEVIRGHLLGERQVHVAGSIGGAVRGGDELTWLGADLTPYRARELDGHVDAVAMADDGSVAAWNDETHMLSLLAPDG